MTSTSSDSESSGIRSLPLTWGGVCEAIIFIVSGKDVVTVGVLNDEYPAATSRTEPFKNATSTT